MLYPQRNKCREAVKLDGFWNFKIDPENVGVAEGWYNGLNSQDQLAVPGSWNEQITSLYNYFGAAWYEKNSFVSESWKGRKVFIRVGSARMKSRIWINGIEVGTNDCGDLPFEFEISPQLKFGEENRITIQVDMSMDIWTLPPSSQSADEARMGFFNSNPPVAYDFFPFGGIHRPVWLYSVNHVFVESVKIDSDVQHASARISFKIQLNSEFKGKVRAYSGEHVCEVDCSGDTCSGSMQIPEPRLWSTDDSHLYEMKVELLDNGSACDSYTQTYGIRTFEIIDNALYLNGKKVFLNGFGKHEDYSASGRGLNQCVIVKDADLMKWIGANSYRTSHYPYAEEMLDYADHNGFLVIGETPLVGLSQRMYNPEVQERAVNLTRRMIDRDYNHPSIIMWSLANEPNNCDTPEADKFFKALADTARSMDSRRPITYAAHRLPEDNPCIKYFDVCCINKYFGWYESPGDLTGSLPRFSECLDAFWNEFGKPLIVTEFGADAVAGEHFLPAQMFSEEFQSEMIEMQYKKMREKEYVVGAHVWAFADFKTAQATTRIIYNRKGVFTRDRQPKLAAHMLKRLWS